MPCELLSKRTYHAPTSPKKRTSPSRLASASCRGPTRPSNLGRQCGASRPIAGSGHTVPHRCGSLNRPGVIGVAFPSVIPRGIQS